MKNGSLPGGITLMCVAKVLAVICRRTIWLGYLSGTLMSSLASRTGIAPSGITPSPVCSERVYLAMESLATETRRHREEDSLCVSVSLWLNRIQAVWAGLSSGEERI